MVNNVCVCVIFGQGDGASHSCAFVGHSAQIFGEGFLDPGDWQHGMYVVYYVCKWCGMRSGVLVIRSLFPRIKAVGGILVASDVMFDIRVEGEISMAVNLRGFKRKEKSYKFGVIVMLSLSLLLLVVQ